MKNLRLLRKQNNLTQRECAAALSMPKTTYCYYEQGKISPSMETLLKIADHFNCSIDYLLGHETQGILHLDSFTESQQKAISLIKKLDEDQMLLLLGYLARMTDTPLNEIISQKKGV